jgi:hypothetical protein
MQIFLVSNLLLGKEISVLLVRSRGQSIILPELRGKVGVCVSESKVKSLDKVTSGTGVTSGGGVAIINSGHVQKLLSDRGRNQSSTTWGWNETDGDGSTLSSDLARDGVGQAGSTAPVSTTDRGDGELGSGDGTTDGSGNLSSTLDSKTNVSSTVTKGDESLEAGALTGRRLFLDRHDLHDLIIELVLEEKVNDLGFLDRKGVKEDLFNGSDLSFLDETSKLGDWGPDVLVTSTSGTSSATSSAAAAAITSSAATAAFTSSTAFTSSSETSTSFATHC